MTYKEFSHRADLHGHAYRGHLIEDGDTCTETVFENEVQVHNAVFPASNIRGASRREYLKVMTESIADQQRRQRVQLTGWK